MDDVVSCFFCIQPVCVCEDNYDIVIINKEKFVLFRSLLDISFQLIPLTQFLSDRGDPFDYCFHCHKIKLFCDCGKKSPFDKSCDRWLITEQPIRFRTYSSTSEDYDQSSKEEKTSEMEIPSDSDSYLSQEDVDQEVDHYFDCVSKETKD